MTFGAKNMLITGVVSTFAILWTVWGFWDKSKLNTNHKLQKGVITKCTYGGKGNAGHILMEYNFELQRKIFTGTYSILSSKITPLECEKEFVGKYFPLIFNPENPANSRMLILPKDFYSNQLSFPDSLKWVMGYVKE